MKRTVLLALLVIGLGGCRPFYLQTVEPTGPLRWFADRAAAPG